MAQQKSSSEGNDVVSGLGARYDYDMMVLSDFDVDTMTDSDVKRLEILSMKYHFRGEVGRKNAHKVIGNLMSIIQDKYEELAIGEVLERQREKSSGRMPRKDQMEVEDVPDEDVAPTGKKAR